MRLLSCVIIILSLSCERVNTKNNVEFEVDSSGELYSQTPTVISSFFHNNLEQDVKLYYGSDENPLLIGKIDSLGTLPVSTFHGHRFFATLDGPGDDKKAVIYATKGITEYHVGTKMELSTTKAMKQPLHSAVKYLDRGRSQSVNARFRSMSSRTIDLYYQGDGPPSFLNTLTMGQDTSSASYEGHKFIYTPHGEVTNVLGTIIIDKDKPLYLLEDKAFPASQAVQDHTTAEIAFIAEHKNRTGVYWRSYFGPDGPRAPPKLYMWSAEEIGHKRNITSKHGVWNCDGPVEKCQDKTPITVTMEVISTEPRAFILSNVLSDFECDAIISLSSPKLHRSTVGELGSKAAVSETRSSKNTWISRSRSSVTETLALRAAELLNIDEKLLHPSENGEELQVVHYEVGQKYDPHHDWGVRGYPESRFITLLFYLNNKKHENAGGETAFPKAGGGRGIKVHPGKGSAVLFYNLLPDGNADDLALHEATPVKDGEKWLANYWIWDPHRRHNAMKSR
mmetsp:Transcript_6542/g.6766  ORF Transcript_6542/g.6766 Transcript_6542/m.6766 type:complete len:508 (-) Transcript_6542:187-1710(-)